MDSTFFLFFSILVIYFLYKHSIHYFAFLEASHVGNAGGRVTSFVRQFFRDFMNNVSVILRFYILWGRINMYDILEDVFDTYYIFVGDFDDDEYISELFMSIHGTLFFTNDNHDDRSFLLEDENGFASDLFYIYFLV